MEFMLKESKASDLEVFFEYQLDEASIQMAAFTSENPNDKEAYLKKWSRLLEDPTAHLRTIIYNDDIAGVIAKFELDGQSQITYWIGERYWGRGVASKALEAFLELESTRPLYGRVAFDNYKCLRVMEKAGFSKIDSKLTYSNARKKEIEEIILELT